MASNQNNESFAEALTRFVAEPSWESRIQLIDSFTAGSHYVISEPMPGAVQSGMLSVKPGDELHLLSLSTPAGETVFPVFIQPTNILKLMPEGAPYLVLPGEVILDFVAQQGDAGIVVNPNSELCVELRRWEFALLGGGDNFDLRFFYDTAVAYQEAGCHIDAANILSISEDLLTEASLDEGLLFDVRQRLVLSMVELGDVDRANSLLDMLRSTTQNLVDKAKLQALEERIAALRK